MRLRYRLFTFILMCAAVPAAPGVSGLGAQSREIVSGEIGRRTDDFLRRLVPFGFSGAVLIAKDGEIVLKKGYGFADREQKVAYTADMVSCIGSVTKQFTGAAILKLEMMGKLKTDDPISKYLPGVPPDKAGITIHHLMTHTAGFRGDMGGSDEEPISRDDLVARVLAAPLVSKPGEQFEYSNEGFSLAGAIIERVSGQKYEAFLREQLFLPADMSETGYVMAKWPLSRLPIGYRTDGERWGRVYRNGWLPDEPGWYLTANGGIHASLDDLYRWHLALERSKILSPEAVRKLQQGFAPALGGREQYGYGWGISTTRRGTKAVTHNGGNGFLFTDFRRYVDENVVIIAMTNQPVIPATLLAPRDLESLAFGDRPPTEVPVIADVQREAREAHAGTYRLTSGSNVTVAVHEQGLTVSTNEPALYALQNGLTAPGERFAAEEARTRPIVEASARGDFKVIFDAFNDDRPFEVVRGNQTKMWQQMRAELGEYVGYDILGTGTNQGDPAVAVLVRFERGSQVLRFVWGPRRLAGFIIDRAGGGAPVVVHPEDANQYVKFDYRQPGNTLRVQFKGRELTLTVGKTVLTATR